MGAYSMTLFTDVYAALEEAAYLAEQTDKPHAIVRDLEQPDAMRVMSYTRAWYDRREIIEVCNPFLEGVA